MRVLLGAVASTVLLALHAQAVSAQKEAPKTASQTAQPAAPGKVAKVPDKQNSCITCHGTSELWDTGQRRLFVTVDDVAGDIHWKKGLRCHNCHGGNPTANDIREAPHAEEDGFRSLRSMPKDYAKPPEPAKSVELCGNCHADIEFMRRYNPSPRVDQLREYWSSGHGKRLKEAGDAAVATCVSCHDRAHGTAQDQGKSGIRSIADLESPVYPTRLAETCAKCHSDEKQMAGRTYHGKPLGHDQYERWKKSVHAEALLKKGDLSAPTCNDCHGNHGALPPEVGAVANACGTCHGKEAKLFAETTMRHRFEKFQLPGCATCHGEHLIAKPTDAMLGMEKGAVCVECHEKGQYGATIGGQTARALQAELDNLKGQIARAEETVAAAERLGMQVRGPRFDLRKAEDSLRNAKVTLHSFALPPMRDALAEGLQVVEQVQERADHALEEHDARRVWLAASLVPILVVIVLLVLYIRTLPSGK